MSCGLLLLDASFNPRLRGGGDKVFGSMRLNTWGFNPRLRGGGDSSRRRKNIVSAVSIHASGGEATEKALIAYVTSKVSIHASGGEATYACTCVAATGIVSIHASGGEATSCLIGHIIHIWFQSTPPGGRRRHRVAQIADEILFQSTPPGGRRLWCSQPCFRRSRFQSTPPGGRRLNLGRGWQNEYTSFNPRLRGGGDTCQEGKQYCIKCFNPRLRGGGDVPPM